RVERALEIAHSLIDASGPFVQLADRAQHRYDVPVTGWGCLDGELIELEAAFWFLKLAEDFCGDRVCASGARRVGVFEPRHRSQRETDGLGSRAEAGECSCLLE